MMTGREPRHDAMPAGSKPQSAGSREAPPLVSTPQWQASQLLQQRREVEIVHADQIYRLRLTARGKLILTK
jgi:hemin uptake protein HemP